MERKGSEGEALHLCQRSIDQAGCKSKDVHEWQGPEGEIQQANPRTDPHNISVIRPEEESEHANLYDKPPQYFSENLSHIDIKIEPALPKDFSPRHFRLYQLVYTPGGLHINYSYEYV
ncbi:hypothetical protein Fot_20529 [Forsythia ovata]|uniref:Uncharacterized protein n=1 Tax=Forsythia ovata TaxID=205694 RepID=A0ABD1UU28_9LAMI